MLEAADLLCQGFGESKEPAVQKLWPKKMVRAAVEQKRQDHFYTFITSRCTRAKSVLMKLLQIREMMKNFCFFVLLLLCFAAGSTCLVGIRATSQVFARS